MLTLLSSQFVETIDGLATIRAFQWQKGLIERSIALLDISQGPFYLLFCVQRWLTLVVNLMTAGLATLVITLAVELRGTMHAGFTGVALFTLISFSDSLSSTITTWTVMETSIGAVARIKLFETETISEKLPSETHVPMQQWPPKGMIEFRDMGASYQYVKKAFL